MRDANLRRTIALIKQPAPVIAGQHDTVPSARHREEIAAAIPGAQLRMLDTVHLANVEQPDAFLEAVPDFLAVPETA
ncbi:alpha/beta fold hydrolase [Ralstonia sp. SET104]|uniref:alpha/beta fold hydrolase n=1 Tax=Ralstonia sp. SET104 TaxID=2448774 RepID=UPI000FFA4208|nr:alpha/beta hydrolase [Ralstonia sp. SET104]GCB06354.1 hypothetical protein PSUB009319_39850 [Ralstonia sp. SET104]